MMSGDSPAPVEAEAVTFGRPSEWVVARPAESMVTRLLSDEPQATSLVRSWVLPSLNVPVAVNCCWEPSVTLGLEGVTRREDSVGGVFVPEVQPTRPSAVNTKARRIAGEKQSNRFL
jgi:hypothetical protein